jgi:hypothetical protein
VIAIGNGQLSLGTVARNSLAWDWGNDGLLKEYAVNTPVTGYDPATGILRGTQAWPQVTNSLLQNRNLAATWINDTVSAQTQTGIDGVANKAWLSTDDSAVSTTNFRQTVAVPNDSNTHSGIIFIRKDEDETRFPELTLNMSGATDAGLAVQLNTKTGQSATRFINGTASYSIIDMGDNWGIVVSATNNSSGNTALLYRVYPAVSTTLGGVDAAATGSIIYDFGGIYLNTAAGLVVPIETGATAVTREADDVSVLTSAFPYNQAAGTIVAEWLMAADTTSPRIWSINDGTISNRIFYIKSSTVWSFVVTVSGASTASMPTGTVATMVKFKAASAYEADNFAQSLDGVSAVTDTSGAVPGALTTFRIGSGETNINHLAGWISDLTYYPTRLSNAQLQALST